MDYDWAARRKIDSLEARLARVIARDSRSRSGMVNDVVELEEDLGRAVLLLQALLQAIIRKGLLTREEIMSVAAELDLRDGEADGQLDPRTVRPPGEREPERPGSPEAHLARLERSGGPHNPGEFLRGLEDAEE